MPCKRGHCGIPDNTAVSDGVHLLVPFATCSAGGCAEALQGLRLPNLQRLLGRMAVARQDDAGLDTLSPPHERALAHLCGIGAPDGLIPLAAWQVRQDGRDPAGEGWAFITPCHWQVATDHARMTLPQALQLSEADSRAMLAAMHPYFAEDGITLDYQAPLRWLARGALFRQLPTASLDRAVAGALDPWMPAGEAGRPLRRLQQEMQMLLYTSPLNDARQQQGLPPVNSFWASGSGTLPAGAATQAPAGVRVTQELREPALRGDWAAWAAAWARLDASECAGLAAQLAGGADVAITLCGERGARTWSSRAAGWKQRAAAWFGGAAPARQLEGL